MGLRRITLIIKIQGNRVCENDLHVWILVSDATKDWVDIPFSIDTPKFETLSDLVSYITKKEERITYGIQGKLDNEIELKHNNMVVDLPELITDDTVFKEIKKEKKIRDKMRELAIKELEKEGEL